MRRRFPILLEVFDESVANLDLRTPEEGEEAAKIIIRLAQYPSDRQRKKAPCRSHALDAKGTPRETDARSEKEPLA